MEVHVPIFTQMSETGRYKRRRSALFEGISDTWSDLLISFKSMVTGLCELTLVLLSEELDWLAGRSSTARPKPCSVVRSVFHSFPSIALIISLFSRSGVGPKCSLNRSPNCQVCAFLPGGDTHSKHQQLRRLILRPHRYPDVHFFLCDSPRCRAH